MKGHLLGNVVMGLPRFDYEDDEEIDEDYNDDGDDGDDGDDDNKKKMTPKAESMIVFIYVKAFI